MTIKELNEITDLVIKILAVGSIENPKDTIPRKEIEKAEILNTNLEEMHRTYDHISNIYDQLRVKALAFIAGEIAIVTFLFISDIKLPEALYGQIIFIGGILSLLCAFGLLLWTIAAVQWKIPCDFEKYKDMKDNYSTKLELTEYIHDEYVKAIQHCLPLVSMKAKRFNLTIYLLSAGVIMILLIKYGGPSV